MGSRPAAICPADSGRAAKLMPSQWQERSKMAGNSCWVCSRWKNRSLFKAGSRKLLWRKLFPVVKQQISCKPALVCAHLSVCCTCKYKQYSKYSKCIKSDRNCETSRSSNSDSTQDLLTTQSVFRLTFILDASVLCKKKENYLKNISLHFDILMLRSRLYISTELALRFLWHKPGLLSGGVHLRIYLHLVEI